jgi:hypothetical protein
MVVLGLFFVLIIANDLFFPYSIEQAGYTVVDIRRLEENPLPLEGLNISSTATAVFIIDNGSFYSVSVAGGVTLIFASALGHPVEGERFPFRGTSWIGTNRSIIVHEFYEEDNTSPLIRSVSGIILFIIMFFMIFKIDFRKVAFTLRREEHA